jgi:hypothetical protein
VDVDGEWTTLALVQPTRRREWQLRHGEETVAELRLPTLKRGGRARAGGRELEIRASGLLRVQHTVVDASSGEELAHVHGRSVELRGSEAAEWKSLGRGKGSGLVGPDGQPWLRAKASSGTFRTSGQVEVAPGHDVALPAVLAAYLLIRKLEDTAAASAATVAAT